MKWQAIVSYVSLIICNINADAVNHFSKFSTINELYKYKNIDFVALINLDERTEKLDSCLLQLSKYNIHPYRFSAVNGWKLNQEELNDIGATLHRRKKSDILATTYREASRLGPHQKIQPIHEIVQSGSRYFVHCTAPGTIGIMLSHLSLINHIVENNYQLAWIMEDDIDVKRNPEILEDYVKELDEKVGRRNWDFFFTDSDITNSVGEKIPCLNYDPRHPSFTPVDILKYYKREKISENLTKVGSRFGMTSYIVTLDGARKLIRHIKKHNCYFPIDIEFSLPQDIQVFCVNSDVVTNQEKPISDNGNPNYLNK